MTDAVEIALAWYEALRGSVDLAAWSLEQFGADPAVHLGFDAFDKPGRPHLPFVALVPVKDSDGLELAAGSHVILACMGCEDAEVVEDADLAKRHRGYQTLAAFEHLVLGALADTDWPPSSWECESSQPGKGYFERHAMIQVSTPNTIGRTI
ncbi:MAG: hypothetical protein PHV85_00095 [Desulfovibrionaceae bacterium]|nr:hypothetical protein [Desulfovibrionaceae bacterium]